MNLFFLVEGAVAETAIYRSWLAHLVPHLQEKESPQEVTSHNYYLVSMGGQSNVKRSIKDAILEINVVGRFDYLVVCLDAEEATIAFRTQEVQDYLQYLATRDEKIELRHAEFRLIIQNRCLETWLLGNQAIYPDTPKDKELQDYLAYYHAGLADPELMGNNEFATHAQFHKKYLWLLFAEQNIRNKQKQLQQAAKATYLSELQKRITVTPTHLQTFQTFIEFCQRITL